MKRLHRLIKIGQREITNTGEGSSGFGENKTFDAKEGGVYNMNRHTLFLDNRQLKRLNALRKAHGGLKQSQLIRLAITKFIQRETRRAAKATVLGE